MKRRVLTALVAIPVVLGVVGCTNPGPIGLFVLLVAFVCLFESESLFSESPDPPIGAFIGFLATCAIVLLSLPNEFRGIYRPVLSDPQILLPLMSALWALGLVAAQRRAKGEAGFFFVAWSVLWFAAPLAALVYLHPRLLEWRWELPNPLLLALLPIWAGDTAAMLGGKAFGKHKLAPTISPNKTWEGAIANLLASIFTGWGVGAWLGYEPWVGLACGAAAGVFGQMGDLFESALKRASGKKDCGTILPGHGGVLDRIDALLGAAVPIWLILTLSGSI